MGEDTWGVVEHVHIRGAVLPDDYVYESPELVVIIGELDEWWPAPKPKEDEE